MSDPVRYAELENDSEKIAAFKAAEVARTEAAFCDPAFEADVERLAATLEDPENIGLVTRYGAWVYNWHRDAAHPRGLWRRVPDGERIGSDANWVTVFDLDDFCALVGADWHWRGAEPLWSDPERALISLSHNGSDQTRHIEWDCTAAARVPGGFDLAPARSSVTWLDANTILLATSDVEQGATASGWQRVVLQLRRGVALEDAPVVYEVEHADLTTFAYTFPRRNGGRGVAFLRLRHIGDVVKTLQLDDRSVVLSAPAYTTTSHNDTHYAYVASDDGPDPAGTLVLQRLDGSEKRILFSPGERRAVQNKAAQFTRDFVYWIETDTLVPTLWRLDLRTPTAAPEELPLPCDAQSVGLSPFDGVGNGTGPMVVVTAGFLTPTQAWLFDQYDTAPDYTCLTSATRSFDSAGMEVRLHTAISDDGTEVPYHIVLPKAHSDRQGKLPVLQYGYGGFGVALGPYYLRQVGLTWLERGGAYVLAYIRGGTELGAAWHLAAKREKRMRSYEDFAAIASDLVSRGYTRADKIACHGGSNGGLLCGVMLTRFPERFGAVWASVGVFDQLRFHLFPAGAGWIDEYGDPEDPAARVWLRAYSPVHNVSDRAEIPYPPALIDTNDTDDRVDPSHSRRFAAILRDAGQPVWFHSRSGGHGGGGRTVETAAQLALGYAFLRRSLKV